MDISALIRHHGYRTHRPATEPSGPTPHLLYRDASVAPALPTPHPPPLLPDPPVHSPSFLPRGAHRILQRSPPTTRSKLELLRRMRVPLRPETDPLQTPGYRTWLEVSRLPPLLPLRPDQPYDSAVWRQLTSAPSAPQPPDPIPPPSRMEENTWSKYLTCRGMRRNEREARGLNLRSQGRAPPTDPHGNILPPKGFKRYQSPVRGSVTEAGPVAVESGFFTAPQHPPRPRKLTLQSTSPNHKQILQRYRELQRGARSVAPYNSRMGTPRMAAQLTPT